jgi:DNA-binding beta-propeller fold protein YncE
MAMVKGALGRPWDENHKFVKALGAGIAVKAHGMGVDAEDNIWVTDQFGPTGMEFSPEARLLKTIDVKGKSGVWDEATGLLWQPLDLAFAPNGAGPGKFSMVHGIAVNPNNGNVYIGDREEYRIVVYDGNGKFIKTIQMRNLVCALYVDPHNQLWMATGQDGQFFKIDWDGNVLGAIGNGPGRGEGQFVEASYMAMDSRGNLFTGDTSVGRITEMVAPKK